MKIDDKTLEHANNFGALGYDNETMAVILRLPIKDITAAMKKSPFAEAYTRGQIMSEYRIDQKLLEMAQGGDLKAIAELNKRTENY